MDPRASLKHEKKYQHLSKRLNLESYSLHF